MGTDRSLWLYRSVPMGPVVDATSPGAGFQVGEPLIAAFEELAGLVSTRIPRRATSRSQYRKIHLLLVNVPRYYTPPPDHPIAGYLRTGYGAEVSDHRVLLLGVRLVDRIGGSGGLKAAVSSVVETLTVGTTPLEDFDADYRAVEAGLSRAGMVTPSRADLTLANAWWNHGRYPDTPLLVHGDHLHVFTDSMSATTAAGLPEQACRDWPEIPGHHAITFASVQNFDLPYISAVDRLAHWVPPLLASGVRALSIRAMIEPSHVTRYELRRQRKRNIEDINEFAAAGKMERAEQTEKLAQLEEVEAAYAMGGPPTLVDASVMVGVDGQVDDITELGRRSGLELHTMDFRQQPAMFEMMLCSPVRANPHLHDLPSQTVACSGLPSLSTVGDHDGALVGFTEQDRQPAYLSPTAASTNDGLPLFVGIGQTGSGKSNARSTLIPTVSGWTRMGNLEVGDSIFGRDGQPHMVQAIFDHENLDFCDVHLSDGQVIRACVDHQWLVSTWQDRNSVHHPHRTTAIERYRAAQRLIEDLMALSEQFADADERTDTELFDLLVEAGLSEPWSNAKAVYQALHAVECPSRFVQRTVVAKRTKRQVVKNDPVLLFPVCATLHACIDRWSSVTGGNATRWGDKLTTRIAAAETVLDKTDADAESTTAEITRSLIEAGASMTLAAKSKIATYARDAGVEPRRGRADVVLPMPAENITHRRFQVWSTPLALKYLALRLSQMFSTEPSDRSAERVLTTGEMLAAGVKYNGAQSNFAIRVAAPLDLPEADLVVDPYVLGAWLGDGGTGTGEIAQGFSKVCTDESGLTDQVAMRSQIVAAGYEMKPRKNPFIIAVVGLIPKLRAAGVLHGKHIPIAYLRASKEQRLALLQGLMDTDGTIDQKGACELCLCDERLATDALELIRSLGIKASMTEGDAAITEADPDNPGHKRRRVTSIRYRIHFTTDQPVFRLPRKAERLPTELRETQRWLYITDITPAPSEPGRCITVDSPDHTYLVEGFVPTHNTMLLLNLADQYARMDTPVVIVDPKALALDTPVPTPEGMSTIGEIAVGDKVYDRRGDPCSVIAKSPVFAASQTTMYRFTFADGQTLLADAHHQWPIYNQAGVSAFGIYSEQLHARWRSQRRGWALTLRRLADDAGSEKITLAELSKIIKEADPQMGRHLGRKRRLYGMLRREYSDEPRHHTDTWPADEALCALAHTCVVDADAPFGRTVTTSVLVDELTDAQGRMRSPIAGEYLIPVAGAGHAGRTDDVPGFVEIVAVEPVDGVDAQCLSVDSPDHTYVVADGLVTHNTGSAHDIAVKASGGQVISLDAIAAADGVFDPLRFAISPEAGIDMASSLLLNVNPWGSHRADFESPLNVAISYGVRHNAGCIGDALRIAERAGKADPAMVDAAFALAEASPMFRACFGIEPGTTPLRLAKRITLIKVGNAHLDLPDPGVAAAEMSLNQRVALALVKMMVFGSAMALTGRRGVVMLDEAWVFLGSGRAEVERLGRLARSQGVLPMLFTQRVTDALNAGLAGYISRGFILPITDEDEAVAACELFKLEPTSERIGRLTAKATLGAAGDEGGAPNWRSMRALRDPVTNKVMRGAVGIYADLFGRAVPVEVRIPDDFLRIASTNPDDIIARDQRRALESGDDPADTG